MKKVVLILALLCVVALAVTGCSTKNAPSVDAGKVSAEPTKGTQSSPSAKPFEGETLVVQVWGGNYEETLKKTHIPIFEELTGATVELYLGVAPVAQLKAQGNNPSVDVVHLGSTEAASAISMGVLAKLDMNNIPNAADLYDVALETPYTIATNWGSFGIAYNTELVKTPPTSWEDFWDPRFSGKIGLWNIEIDNGIEMLEMTARLQGTSLVNTGDWDKIYGKIAELKDDTFIFATSHADIENAFVSKDIEIAFWTNGRAARMKANGYPIAYVAPVEGTPAMTTLVGVAAGTHKKELAEIFINVSCGIEAQKAIAMNNYYGPTNKKVVLDDDYAKLLPYGSEAVGKLLFTDNVAIEKYSSKIIERWNKEMS